MVDRPAAAGFVVHEVAGLRLRAPDVELGRPSVFAHLWPAGVVLAEYVAGALATTLAGRRVLELGCGLGAAGLAAARHGADVVLSDAADAALALAESNAHANRLTVEVVRLRWGRLPAALAGRFDVVLGADVTYDARERRRLLATIEAALAPGGTAWLADPGRTSRRELEHHTALAVEPWARFPPRAGLVTGEGNEDRNVVLYRLTSATGSSSVTAPEAASAGARAARRGSAR